jgi:hypothetical protein
VLIGLVLWEFQLAPAWELLWYHNVPHVTARAVHMRGYPGDAGRWIEGGTIRVYQLPDLPEGKAGKAADGIQALLDDIGLDFSLEVRPMPDDVLAAYTSSIEEQDLFGEPAMCLNLKRFQKQLISLREGDWRADVVIVEVPFAEGALGFANTFSGVMVMSADAVNIHIAKHEACHLMGYMLHDMLPLFVFGYRWEDWPWRRDSLMLSMSGSDDLLPRTRGALRAHWRGMEKRMGRQFLKDE